MPNEVKLQEGHPVDENLRPLKVGGKSTAIETAQHGDGARVTGNLEAGDIKGKDLTVDSLTVDDVGIDGKVITMTGSTGDTFTATVATDGVTVLATTDAGGTAAHLNIEADGHVEFDNCAVGFDAIQATFGDSDSIGGGGSSTDIDFRLGNKYTVELTAHIDSAASTYINLIFPATSGNFTLVVGQDGTGSRTIASGSWRAYAVDESLCNNVLFADGTDGEIRWAGGSAPTLTTTADKADIISIYWNPQSQTAFAVASLNF